ncbi:hypothetical protein EG68_01613 [Paragonimus skrjabini miyazakii]|uniref:Thioredoxin-like fold domain-containing protein n=1 Tax=Paragonimus skrjabini miyazakii TaxID=59628 RepID=A0A8S9Z251_9TREM|nr:hypothetical protein EG68_01613 [Paragonimus skrjabini miyazakii]
MGTGGKTKQAGCIHWCSSSYVFLATAGVSKNTFRRLSELSLYNSVPKLTFDEFRTFALSKPRNYSLFVYLTALSKHHFTDQLKHVEIIRFYPIRLAEQEFRILADSWKRRSGELFFALADHDRDPEIFQMLNLTTVPAILYVNPKGAIKSSDFMNIQRYGLSADAVADWIEGLTSIRLHGHILTSPVHDNWRRCPMVSSGQPKSSDESIPLVYAFSGSHFLWHFWTGV